MAGKLKSTSPLLCVALRSVCFHPRTGEVPPPVHPGALRETFRHEECPSGHRSYHRAQNRYDNMLPTHLHKVLFPAEKPSNVLFHFL